MNGPLTEENIVGSFTCPHDDGDFTLTVYDLRHWSTGSCMIRQDGQGGIHDVCVTAREADRLAEVLARFSARYPEQ